MKRKPKDLTTKPNHKHGCTYLANGDCRNTSKTKIKHRGEAALRKHSQERDKKAAFIK